MRVHLSQREMAKHEAKLIPDCLLKALQLPMRLSAKRTLEIAVLQKRVRVGRSLGPILGHGLASACGCGSLGSVSSCFPVIRSSASSTPSTPGLISIGETWLQ